MVTRVVILSDKPSRQTELQDFLVTGDVDSVSATAWSEAASLVVKIIPDVIVVDLENIEPDNTSQLEQLLGNDYEVRPDVIAITSAECESAAIELLQKGIVDHLVNMNDSLSSLFLRELIQNISARRNARVHRAIPEATEKSTTLNTAEIVSAMSYLIRTPLTSILGYSDALSASLEDPLDIEAAQTIRRNGKLLLDIVHDSLTLAEIGCNTAKSTTTEVPLLDLVTDITVPMQVQATAKGIRFDASLDGPLPERIQTNPDWIREMLVFLLGDVIKSPETNWVRLVSRVTNEQNDNAQLEFDIVQSPGNLGETEINLLSQSNQKLSTSGWLNHRGLRLLIVRQLAEKLGGNLSSVASQGDFDTFRLTIPVGSLNDVPMIHHSEDEQTKSTGKQPEETVSTTVESKTQAVKGSRILLAEDCIDSQRLISSILEIAGAKVTVAHDGQTAVDLALSARDIGKPFDVILMDIEMPILDGYEATCALRSDGYQGTIVALTAHARSDDRTKCLAAGCNDYASKPIDRQNLLELISSHITSAVGQSLSGSMDIDRHDSSDENRGNFEIRELITAGVSSNHN